MAEEIIPEFEDGYIPLSKAVYEAAYKYVDTKIGRLTITKVLGKHLVRKAVTVRAQCECGNTKETSLTDIVNNHTKSCGCLRVKHGEANTRKKYATREYSAWVRVLCKTMKQAKDQSLRQEELVCPEWLDKKAGYINFLQDLGRKPNGKSRIYKKDNSKPYSKENCYWWVKDEGE